MADDAGRLNETGVIGMADYRAARLHAQEAVVIELLARQAGLAPDDSANPAADRLDAVEPGSEDGAARLRALEAVIIELLKRERDQDWLGALRRQTQALPLTPDWVGLWRTAQLQLLGQVLPPPEADFEDDDFDDE